MANVVFFSFKESDRSTVLTIKGRAVNPDYPNLNFRVRDLLKRVGHGRQRCDPPSHLQIDERNLAHDRFCRPGNAPE